jgi:hypothetical protein
MEIAILIKHILSGLENTDIPACIIGEIALNYCNVPRVVHDIIIRVKSRLNFKHNPGKQPRTIRLLGTRYVARRD